MSGCPVLERGPSRELVVDNDYRWVVFPETGFMRIDPMPSLDEAIELQSEELGAGYISDYDRKAKSKMRRSLRRAKFFKRQLSGKRVLDVGSNVGFFVGACHSLGLQAEGLEINPVLVANAQTRFPDCSFHNTPLEHFQGDTGQFDGIYCSEVIEHVPDPVAFAKTLLGLLKPGGVLYMTTPCANEYVKDGKAIRDMGAPDHKFYFDKRNIHEFLRHVGFSESRNIWSLGKGVKILAKK